MATLFYVWLTLTGSYLALLWGVLLRLIYGKRRGFLAELKRLYAGGSNFLILLDLIVFLLAAVVVTILLLSVQSDFEATFVFISFTLQLVFLTIGFTTSLRQIEPIQRPSISLAGASFGFLPKYTRMLFFLCFAKQSVTGKVAYILKVGIAICSVALLLSLVLVLSGLRVPAFAAS